MPAADSVSPHLITFKFNQAILMTAIQSKDFFSMVASLVGGWQAVPVQTNAVASVFVDKVLANGSTAPALPKIILFG